MRKKQTKKRKTSEEFCLPRQEQNLNRKSFAVSLFFKVEAPNLRRMHTRIYHMALIKAPGRAGYAGLAWGVLMKCIVF